MATKTDTRAAALLPLLQELVELNVKRWDVERRIELEIFDGAELEFTGEAYSEHVSSLSVSCDAPTEAYNRVTLEDARQFAECLEAELDEDEDADAQ